MLAVDVVHGSGAIAPLANDWWRILRSCSRGVAGPDVTASPLWAQALLATYLNGVELEIVVLREEGRVVGLLPMYRRVVPGRPLSRRELITVTDAHSGRCGLLVEEDREDLIAALLTFLNRQLRGWDVFTFTVVEGSASHKCAARLLAEMNMPLRLLATYESPYITLPQSWDDYFAALPKKFRWLIRKGEKDLGAQGELAYEEITTAAGARELLSQILQIEERSWKEQSGTSITVRDDQQRFYNTMVAAAAEQGILSGHVLRVGARPVAHILGLRDEAAGVFLDLKESFDLSFADQSPGHVLKRFAMARLIERGVRLYDFMGDFEDYKRRWTESSYRRLTLAAFNSTARGRLMHWKARLGKGTQSLDAGPAQAATP